MIGGGPPSSCKMYVHSNGQDLKDLLIRRIFIEASFKVFARYKLRTKARAKALELELELEN